MIIMFFNIHGLYLKVEGDSKVEKYFKEEYNFFKQEDVEREPDILVKGVTSIIDAPEYEISRMREGRKKLHIPLSEINEKLVIRFERGLMPAYIMYMLEPIIYLKQLYKGKALIHACSLALEDFSIVFPSWGGTGKTSIVLYFIEKGFNYMSDDWTFIGYEGKAYAYPRRIRIYHYNLDIFPWLKTMLKNKKLIYRMKILDFLRRRSPSRFLRIAFNRLTPYYSVKPKEIFPETNISLTKDIRYIFLLKKSIKNRTEISEIDIKELMISIKNCILYERNYFFQFYHRYAFFNGEIELIEKSIDKLIEVLRMAFTNKELYRIDVPIKINVREIYDMIAKII